MADRTLKDFNKAPVKIFQNDEVRISMVRSELYVCLLFVNKLCCFYTYKRGKEKKAKKNNRPQNSNNKCNEKIKMKEP